MSNSDDSDKPHWFEFKMKIDETAVIQLASGEELLLACYDMSRGTVELAIRPNDAIKRVMKLVQ